MEQKRKMSTLDMTYAALFAALMAVGANIAQFIPPIGGVPITLQTFVAILAGAILGSRVATISMSVYTLLGLVGVPVFAKFSGGLGTLVSPSFGFVLTFILLAYVTGKIVEASRKPGIGAFLVACFAGLIINYVLGTTYMYFAYKLWAAAPAGFTYEMAWSWMMVPLPKDIILTVIAGLISPRVYKAVTLSQSVKRNKVA